MPPGPNFFPETGGTATEIADLKRRLAALERSRTGGFSADGETTYLRDRDLRVIGGTIRVEANGDIVIDGGQLVAGPTTVDASGIQVGPTTLNASGLTVGSDVLVDSTGLKIGGVLQPAIGVATAGDASNSSDTLTTTPKNLCTITFTLPSWADTVHFITFNRVQLTTGATARQLHVATNVNNASAPSGFNAVTVPTNSIGDVTSFRASSAGATAVIRGWYALAAGTESSHNERLQGLAWFTRS